MMEPSSCGMSRQVEIIFLPLNCHIFFIVFLPMIISEDINKITLGEFIRDLVALESGGSGGVVWRIRSSPTKLVRLSWFYSWLLMHTLLQQVCAVGSRNGTEETKLMVLDFDAEVKWHRDGCLPIRTLVDTNQFSKPRIFELIWSFGDLNRNMWDRFIW